MYARKLSLTKSIVPSSRKSHAALPCSNHLGKQARRCACTRQCCESTSTLVPFRPRLKGSEGPASNKKTHYVLTSPPDTQASHTTHQGLLGLSPLCLRCLARTPEFQAPPCSASASTCCWRADNEAGLAAADCVCVTGACTPARGFCTPTRGFCTLSRMRACCCVTGEAAFCGDARGAGVALLCAGALLPTRVSDLEGEGDASARLLACFAACSAPFGALLLCCGLLDLW